MDFEHLCWGIGFLIAFECGRIYNDHVIRKKLQHLEHMALFWKDHAARLEQENWTLFQEAKRRGIPLQHLLTNPKQN